MGAQMAKDDGQIERNNKLPKGSGGDTRHGAHKSKSKLTPPTFHKQRLGGHLKLSETDSSTDSDQEGEGTLISVVGRKVKHRDRSKDRLKYKNISEEFDEENMMVLPIKQF